MEINTFNDDPNFSIIMRGGCNAECPFCFNRGKAGDDFEKNQYKWFFRLQSILLGLPSQFYQISITGNEPMLSPDIDLTLALCQNLKSRYTNILLTTNGTKLLEKIDVVSSGVHHINVSRHHYDEEENMNIFGGYYNVTDEELIEIIDRYSARGVDVSLNCVINDDTTKDFALRFIDFAKRVGAHAVRFRKENGDSMDMTPAESSLNDEYPILQRGECPVCRTWMRIIKGMTTYWKAAIIEPTDEIVDSVYELVYDTDGELYLDWNRRIPMSNKCGIKGIYQPCGVVSDSAYMGVSSSCGGRPRSEHC